MSLDGFCDEFQRRTLVPGLGDKGFQHLAFVVHSVPKVMRLAISLHENLVEIPTLGREGTHLVNPFAPDLGGTYRLESVPPKPHRLMTNVDTALGQQVFGVAQRRRLFHVHHDHEPDDLRRRI